MAGANALYSRLCVVEDDFVAALDGDDNAMELFTETWTLLQRDIQQAQLAGNLTQEVAELAYLVSTRITFFAERLEEFYQTTQRLSDELNQELDPLVGPSLKEGTLESRDNSSSGILRSASYIQSAYAWLLDNLHDPYPSRAVKNSLAQKSKSSVKLIDGWFVDIRKRMGWSKIKREHFQNKRKPLIDAATCFFVNGGTLSPELMGEFAAMEMQAKDLYHGRFSESELAARLSSRLSSQPSQERDSRSLYPSPSRSPGRPHSSQSPELVMPDTSNTSKDSRHSRTNNTATGNRKRLRSEDGLVGTPALRSHKRVRYDASSFVIVPECGLPSPASSPSAIEQTSALARDTSPSRRSPSPITVLPKRRRVSDSATHCGPKYPSSGCRIVGLQTVSLPLLMNPEESTIIGTSTDFASINTPVPSLDQPSKDMAATPARSCSPQIIPLRPEPAFASPGEIPHFSSEPPEAVSCDQPAAMRSMDLSFFNSEILGNYHMLPSANDENQLFTPSSFLEASSQTVPPIEAVDVASLPNLLDFFHMPFDQNTFVAPPLQPDSLLDPRGVDIHYSPYPDLGIGASGQLIDDSFGDLFGDIPVLSAPTVDLEKVKQLEYLENLKKQKNDLKQQQDHIQECIQSLERQLNGKVSA